MTHPKSVEPVDLVEALAQLVNLASPKKEAHGYAMVTVDASVLTKASADLRALRAEVGRLRDAVEYFAEGDCAYGDLCTPEAMSLRRHGECTSCRARRALSPEQPETTPRTQPTEETTP